MKLETRQIGSYNGNPAKIIELKITFGGTTIIEEITSFNGSVEYSIIDNLREIADELEEQNNKLEAL